MNERRLKLSTGSTLLNLACSGDASYGMLTGRYYWMVGDSSSGKTFLTLTSMAEAAINPEFDGYDFVFDNAEDGALMDVEKYFGPGLANRMIPPAQSEDGGPKHSTTAEEFYFFLDDRIQSVKNGKSKPFIYLLDSMDALSTTYEGKKFEEKKKASRKGTDAKGDYGDGKAKLNSTYIRRVVAELRDTNSILIILSQTRDNIDAGMFEPAKTNAGGHALKFYASWQLWSSVGARLTKEVNGNTRQIGVISKIAIKKNRMSGKEWSVEVPIYWSFGIDDIGSCVDFLLAENKWEKNKSGVIVASDFEYSGRRDDLIRHVESEGLESELRELVQEVWKDIEKKCVIDRKSRYQ